MKNLEDLAGVTGDQLTARLYELRTEERHLLVEFLGYLAEVDRRKLYLEIGFSSLFKMCTDFLGYRGSSAYRRVAAARLLARFPVVGEYLWDGRLCITTLAELRDVLGNYSIQGYHFSLYRSGKMGADAQDPPVPAR